MSFLCDTNVLSELVKPRPNQGVLRWAGGVRLMALSSIVLEELTYGLAWKPNARIRDWFDDFLTAHCQILPVTAAIARHAGELRGRLRARGRVRTQADMLIAATAAMHELTLVTRNARDFQDCGVALLDPFE